MGNKQAKEDFIEQIRVDATGVIQRAKEVKGKKILNFFIGSMDLIKRLGMISFDIQIGSGAWSLNKINEYLNKLKKEMKCKYSEGCEDEVGFGNDENGDVVCQKHYIKLIEGDEELKEKFIPIEMKIIEVKSKAEIFENTLIKIKAAAAIFKANKENLKNIEELIQQLENYEKKIDINTKKIMDSTLDIEKNKTFQNLILIIREFKQMEKIIIDIMNLWKDSLFSIFYEHLFEKLQECSTISSKEETKQDPK